VGAVVIERGDLTGEEWREAVAGAVRTARNRTDSVLVVIDEARFLAPERETTSRYQSGSSSTTVRPSVARGYTATWRGPRERRDTRDWSMEPTHHGAEGNSIKDP
jgi:hypothetical protein